MQELESAVLFARRATRMPNATYWADAMLATALELKGEHAEAEATVRLLLGRKPDYTQSSAREDFFFCANRSFLDRYVEGLRRAGLPA